jgi:DNA-binding beta-propeller fold protein YncE
MLRHMLVAIALLAPVARSNAQEVLVGSWATRDVRRFALDGTFLGVHIGAGSGGLATPDGLAIRGNSIYVASAEQAAVLRYDLYSGAFQGVFASSNLGRAGFCTFGPDGNMYVCDSPSNSVLRYDGQTGAFIDRFASGNGMGFPAGLTWHNGSLLVAGFGTNAVYRFDAETGAYQSQINGIARPLYMRVANDGLLHVSEYGANRIARFNLATGARVGSFGGGSLNGPVGQLALPDGSLLVSSWNTGRILRYNESATAFLGTFTNVLAQPNDLLLVPTIPAPASVLIPLAGVLCSARRRRRD